MKNIPKIGTGVFIIRDNKILIGKRTNTSLGNLKYGLPGGHLDFGETILNCGSRELREETGLETNSENIELVGFTENISHDKHYVTFFMKCHMFKGTVATPEPDKHEHWEWLTLEEIISLDESLFGPLKSFLDENPDFNTSIT